MMMLSAVVAMAQKDRSEEAHNLLLQGISMHDEGKYDEAIKLYDKALKLDPKNPNIVYEKAYTIYTSGDIKKAQKVLEKSIEKGEASNDYASSYILLATIYDDNGEHMKAIDTYKKATEIPNLDSSYFGNLLFNLGIAYNNAHINLDDKDNKFAIEAINTLTKSYMIRPLHPATNKQLYSLLTEYNFFSDALMHLSYFMIDGKGNAFMETIPDVLEAWTKANVEGASYRSSRDSLVINKVIEIGKQEHSEYGIIYDVFTGVFNTLCAGITDEPMHPSKADVSNASAQILALYAKLQREGEFETLMHYACANCQKGYIANQNWISKNKDHMDKMLSILKDGQYLTNIGKRKNAEDADEVTFESAEEAHKYNADAMRAMENMLEETPGSEESKKAIRYVLAWTTASDDVQVVISDNDRLKIMEDALNANDGVLMFAYMAGCSLYQLEQGKKGFSPEAYYAGIKTMLRYYERHHDAITSSPHYDEYLKQLNSDEAKFKTFIIDNAPKEEE